MNNIKTRFGDAIRCRRKRLGLSQEEVSERAGLHRTYIGDIERGERNVSLENIYRIAQALRTRVSTLLK